MTRKALIIGINDYGNDNYNLNGCINDCKELNNLLSYNEDNTKNFDTFFLKDQEASLKNIEEKVDDLFDNRSSEILFYFAGHGQLKDGRGYIVCSDFYVNENSIYRINDLVEKANNALNGKNNSVTIILDCCHAGSISDSIPYTSHNISAIGNGLSILASCTKNQNASETINNHGLFSQSLINALSGQSANILGDITPASIYAHIDQSLGSWQQRPIYQANVQNFVSLRKMKPKIPLNFLQSFPHYFNQKNNYIYPLDPSCEPIEQRNNMHINIPHSKENEKIFRLMQACNRVGLIIPHRQKHMYYAAMNSTGCTLTKLGHFYRELAINKRF